MELIKDEDTTETAPADEPGEPVQPKRAQRTIPKDTQRVPFPWLRAAIWIIIAAIIIVLIVFGARWIYHKTHKVVQPAPVGISQPQKPSGENKKPASSTPTTQNGQGATPAGQLPNNGPGDIAAIFTGSSLAAAGLHYIINVRRTAKLKN